MVFVVLVPGDAHRLAGGEPRMARQAHENRLISGACGGMGLAQNLEAGKAYHVWMQPASGDPIDIGAIEIDHNGSGYAMKVDLPAIDQGKAVMLTIDASDAKQPGQMVARADLPKLQTTVTPAPPQQAQDQNPPAAQNQQQQNQAKPGTDTQQMHQSK